MNTVRILLVVAIASPLLAVWAGQDADATDWSKDVERACTSPRYALRLAAANKVARAGAPAVPAIRAFAAKHGLDRIPAELVERIADSGTDEPPVLELLRDWANERDFYWRPGALRGLAVRGPRLPDAERDALRPVFASFHGDPAWLMRTHARLGTVLLGDDAPLAQPEDDPRARARLPMLLLQQGRVPPLQPLLDALADERTFQGVPWAKMFASETHRVLKTWLGEQHPVAAGSSYEESVGDKQAALRVLRDACAAKSGQELTVPELRRDPDVAFTGGVEILSCKLGDRFVQWTAAGQVHLGIGAEAKVQIAADTWQRLEQQRRALELPVAMGSVVCDSLRLRWQEPEAHCKAAPASLPEPAVRWLEALAAAIAAGGDAAAGAALRAGLEQFAAR